MTAPQRPPSMGERCLSALTALGGEGTTAEVLARVEADWGWRLVPAQVTTALSRLANLARPPVTSCPDPGNARVKLWRLTETVPPAPWAEGFKPFTEAAAEPLAVELPALDAAVNAALREAG